MATCGEGHKLWSLTPNFCREFKASLNKSKPNLSCISISWFSAVPRGKFRFIESHRPQLFVFILSITFNYNSATIYASGKESARKPRLWWRSQLMNVVFLHSLYQVINSQSWSLTWGKPFEIVLSAYMQRAPIGCRNVRLWRGSIAFSRDWVTHGTSFYCI
jgi:hypothetical protein